MPPIPRISFFRSFLPLLCFDIPQYFMLRAEKFARRFIHLEISIAMPCGRSAAHPHTVMSSYTCRFSGQTQEFPYSSFYRFVGMFKFPPDPFLFSRGFSFLLPEERIGQSPPLPLLPFSLVKCNPCSLSHEPPPPWFLGVG